MIDKKFLAKINNKEYKHTKKEMLKEIEEVENLVEKLERYFSETTLQDLINTIENGKEEINNIKGRWLVYCIPRWDCDGYDLAPSKFIEEEDESIYRDYRPREICNTKEEAEKKLREVY